MDSLIEGTAKSSSHLSKGQLAAIKRSREIARALCREHADVIRQLFDDGKNQTQIAEKIHGNHFLDDTPVIVRVAVNMALDDVVGKRQKYLRARAARIANLPGYVLTKEDLSKGAQSRNAIHGVPLRKGALPWTPEEKSELMKLASDPKYFHIRGKHKGEPAYALILDKLRSIFSDFKHKLGSLSSKVSDLRKLEQNKTV